MPTHKDKKSERIAIYFDCICGIICSISAFFGLFFFALPAGGIEDPTYFVIGICFWFGYLFLSLFIIGVGIYSYYKEKNFSTDEPITKKFKVPIVS